MREARIPLRNLVKWVAFLAIGIGTVAAVNILGGRFNAPRAARAVAMCGISLSVFAWLFVPYVRFYLSELLVVVLALGTTMTMIVNLVNSQGPEVFLLALFVGTTMPFIAFWVVDHRRKPSERAGDARSAKPTEEESLLLRRATTNVLIIGLASIMAVQGCLIIPVFLFGAIGVIGLIMDLRKYFRAKK
ncbi:MAG TPA: hypothetical protein VKX17_25255 [Planctomycetota bacterium]|nr:hypothetical protein [Planctomycetota bacterium]